jgi:hypothetical protein
MNIVIEGSNLCELLQGNGVWVSELAIWDGIRRCLASQNRTYSNPRLTNPSLIGYCLDPVLGWDFTHGKIVKVNSSEENHYITSKRQKGSTKNMSSYSLFV